MIQRKNRLNVLSLLLIGVLFFAISPVSAGAFSGWTAYGDAWKSTNTTHTIIMWNATGSHTWLTTSNATQATYLAVGGGGGGGFAVGSGGGAGGMVQGTLTGLSGSLTVVVGAGGGNMTQGSNSSISSVVALGGGRGIGGTGVDSNGVAGGSGSGARSVTGVYTGGSGYGTQGNAGGPSQGASPYREGGGGGAGSAGTGGSGFVSGAGGSGRVSTINITSVTYACGGGAGGYADTSLTGGAAGCSAGGAGNGSGVGGNAVAGTGSGGGGGGIVGTDYYAGGSGGSGIVMVSFVTPTPDSIVAEPQTSATTAQKVLFTEIPGSPLPHNWSFGDGYTDTTRNQTSHFYAVANNYTATLSLTNTSYPGTFTNVTTYFNLTSDSDTNLRSWMHFNDGSGGTTFIDEMGNAWTPTSVTTETAIKKFGSSSALFNSNNDRLQTPSSSLFNLGANTNATFFEGWVYPTSYLTGDYIISRTPDAAAMTSGWGIYDTTNTDSGWVFWAGNGVTGSTGTFTLPVDTWSFLTVQRYVGGTVNVSVNGVQVATKTGLTGNYDTANPIVLGKPLAGAATNSAKMYLDEFRLSTTLRFASYSDPFSPPYAEYRGALFSPDPNPNSTMRFKTDPTAQPPGNVLISNLTARYRTVQIQNVTSPVSVISTQLTFSKDHVFASGVTANTTQFSGVSISDVVIDNTMGTVAFNATRSGGFNTSYFTDSRGSFADVRMVYVNYTEPEEDAEWDEDDIPNRQFFSYGLIKNATTSNIYPIHNFVGTNVTFLDWQTFSGFGVTTPYAMNQTLFTPNDNAFTANRWSWNFGDGSPVITGNSSYPEPHTFLVPGTYNVTSTAYLWQNASVTNTTTKSVTISYETNYINADFSASPISGSPGTLITFTDLSAYGSTTGLVYNWSFGDGAFSATPYSSVIGNVSHVYTTLGIYTVNLTIFNTYGNSTLQKDNYITISTSQGSTALNLLYPKDVTIKVVDFHSNPLYGVKVEAAMDNSSVESTNWFETLFGITPTADNPRTATLIGYTDNFGVVSFPMVASGSYQMTISNSTLGVYVQKQLQPIQPTYTYVVATTALAATRNSADFITSNLSVVEITPLIYLNMSYADTSSSTTNVNFFVKFANQTTKYSTNFPSIGGSNQSVMTGYPVANVKGDSYVWGYSVTNTMFTGLNQSKGISLNGPTGVFYNPLEYKSGW